MIPIDVLPHYFFKDRENIIELWKSVIKMGVSSRYIPDEITKTIANTDFKKVHFDLMIPHWHKIEPDPDCRNVRSFLQADSSGLAPKNTIKNFDLLRALDLDRQLNDLQYRQYVVSWRLEQEFEVCDDED